MKDYFPIDVSEHISSKDWIKFWKILTKGKSALIKQLAKKSHKKIVELRLAPLDPKDLLGLPCRLTKTPQKKGT